MRFVKNPQYIKLGPHKINARNVFAPLLIPTTVANFYPGYGRKNANFNNKNEYCWYYGILNAKMGILL